jgi:hypothetical protein
MIENLLSFSPNIHLGFNVAAIVAGCFVFMHRSKKHRISFATSFFYCLGTLIGALVLGRLSYMATAGIQIKEIFVIQKAREVAFSGIIVGTLLTLLILSKTNKKPLLSIAAPAFALILVFARLGEYFVLFGSGDYVSSPLLSFFPLSIPDGYGDRLLAVNLFEALAALLAYFTARKERTYPMQRALILICTYQILLESLRVEAQQYGFIRITQVVSAILLVISLMSVLFKENATTKQKISSLMIVILGIAGVGLMEYGLDRLPWPSFILRTVMLIWVVLLHYYVDKTIRLHRKESVHA